MATFWKIHILGAYVLVGLSVAGVLGGMLNGSDLESHYAFMTLVVAVIWMAFIRFMVWWRYY